MNTGDLVEPTTTVTRSYRYRLLPSKMEETELLRQMTAHRWLYNAALEQRITGYRSARRPWFPAGAPLQLIGHCAGAPVYAKAVEYGQEIVESRKITRFSQSLEVKDVKRLCPEFAGISSHSLGQTLGRLDKAFSAFFKRGGFPKFRGMHNFRSISWYMQGV
jgi:putative transposase